MTKFIIFLLDPKLSKLVLNIYNLNFLKNIRTKIMILYPYTNPMKKIMSPGVNTKL